LTSLIRRLALSLTVGAVEGVAYYIVLVEVTPRLLDYLEASLGAPSPALQSSRSLVLAGFMFIGLAVAARSLQGHIAGALISSLTSLLSFIFLAYLMHGGVVSIEGYRSGNVVMSASLDLTPLLIVVFLFYTIPGMILPVVDHFFRAAEEG
jgi:hypothetical protein